MGGRESVCTDGGKNQRSCKKILKEVEESTEGLIKKVTPLPSSSISECQKIVSKIVKHYFEMLGES